MATQVMPKDDSMKPQVAILRESDWTKPQAMALPKEGYFKGKEEQGRYGPIFPKTPACHGFSVVAKVKPGREQAIRDYGKSIEEAVKADPSEDGKAPPPNMLMIMIFTGRAFWSAYDGPNTSYPSATRRW